MFWLVGPNISGLQSPLTLRSEAKRSVSKGGDTKDVAQRCGDHGFAGVVRVATLRDASLRYAPQGEGGVLHETPSLTVGLTFTSSERSEGSSATPNGVLWSRREVLRYAQDD